MEFSHGLAKLKDDAGLCELSVRVISGYQVHVTLAKNIISSSEDFEKITFNDF